MYKQIKTDNVVDWARAGNKVKPIATLADEYGGKAQIVKDDHCYVLLVKQPRQSIYNQTAWWLEEAIEVIKNLDE